MRKIIFAHIKVFAIAMVVAYLLLLSVSLIPQAWLTENLHKGREDYYSKNYPLFILTEQDNYATFIDNGTDQLMMDLSYMLGDERSNILNPLVFSNEMNKEVRYGRYWHGYAVVMRLLMIFMGRTGIIRTLAGITIALFLALIGVLIYKKQYICIPAILLGAYLTHFEVVLQCTEYIFCAIVALSFSLYISLAKQVTELKRYIFYFLAGITVAYFDFLTFETFALALPLIVDISLHDDLKIKEVIISAIDWCIGYVMTFIVKFILFYFVSIGDDMEFSIDKLIDKFEVPGFSIWDGLIANIELIKVLNRPGIWLGLWASCLIIMYIVGIKTKSNIYLFCISLVPIIRFICLSGHSVAHCVFTYHAMFSSITAVILILLSPLKYFVMDKRLKKGAKS